MQIGRIMGSESVEPKKEGEKQPVKTLSDRLRESNVFDVAASMKAAQAGAYGK